MLSTLEIADRVVTIERRLPGRDLSSLLEGASSDVRAALIVSYLDTAARIGDLIVNRDWYGELIRDNPVRGDTFRAYLKARATASLAAGGLIGRVDATAIASAWPEPSEPSFVHLDAFPGNMLADGARVTAVLDFGVISLIGDRRLDPLAAVAYLDPEITPSATDADRAIAHEWLESRGLEPLFDTAYRWLAAFWSDSMADPRLLAWCHRVLGIDKP